MTVLVLTVSHLFQEYCVTVLVVTCILCDCVLVLTVSLVSGILCDCVLVLTLSHLFQEYCVTEFLRVSGVYWGLTAMDLMGQLHRMDKQEVLEFVSSCYNPQSGGFAPTLHHDPHLLYTLSAIQVTCDIRHT